MKAAFTQHDGYDTVETSVDLDEIDYILTGDEEPDDTYKIYLPGATE